MNLEKIETISEIMGQTFNTLWVRYDHSLTPDRISDDARAITKKHGVTVGFYINGVQILVTKYHDGDFTRTRVLQAFLINQTEGSHDRG